MRLPLPPHLPGPSFSSSLLCNLVIKCGYADHGLPEMLLLMWKGQLSRVAALCAMWQVAQSCPTLCDPVDCNPPGSSVHRIFQASILEWVAISLSKGSSRPRDRTWVPCGSYTAGRFFTAVVKEESGKKNLWVHTDINKQKIDKEKRKQVSNTLMSTNKCRKNNGIKRPLFVNHTAIVNSNRKLSMDIKTVGES